MVFGNASELVFGVSCELLAANPVPERATKCGELVAVLPILRLSEAAPTDVGVKVTPNCVLFPALMVTGVVPPFVGSLVITKPEFGVTLAVLIVTLPPTAVRVTNCCALLCPTVIELKVNGFGLALRVAVFGVVPVPERLITAGEFAAVLAMLTELEFNPADCGENVTFQVAFWPACRVRGRFGPRAPNAAEGGVMEFIVTSPPMAVVVMV